MLNHFRLIWQEPTLRMLCAVVLLFGTFGASIGPYQSLIAVKQFGISDTVYAAILMAALLVGVSAAVGIGIITDQRPSRKVMALAASTSIILAASLVWFWDRPVAFVIAHILFLPLSGTVFGQSMAVMRLVTSPWPPSDRDAVSTLMRAIFAVPFALVLPLWGLAFDLGVNLLLIYPVIGIVGGVMLLLILRQWPADQVAPWVEQKSGLGFRASIGEMVAWPVFLRVMLVGSLHSGGALTGVILGLSFAAAGRGPDDVGLFFGAFVVFEILATLCVGTLLRIAPRMAIISCGVCIYASFIALMPLLAGSPWVWLLVIPGGVGGGFFYALAITYLQELLGKRAGAGASLLALQRIASDGLCAGIFALGTWISGYALVGLMGGLGMIAALTTLILLDRYRPL
jgi:MFS transporter, SET family, sugar efflux transporter